MAKEKSVFQKTVERRNIYLELRNHVRYSEENGGIDGIMRAIANKKARQQGQSENLNKAQ